MADCSHGKCEQLASLHLTHAVNVVFHAV